MAEAVRKSDHFELHAPRWVMPLWKGAIPVLVAVVIAILPPPHGLPHFAFHYFGVFMAVILGLVLEPIPAAAVGLVGVTYAAVFGVVFSPAELASPSFRLPTEGLKWALSGFTNATVWLIFGAFMFALGYEKTGLGKRLALVLVRGMGRRTLGLGYAVTVADLLLAPFTPSNTARSGGTIFPLVKNIPSLYGSQPGPTARKIGSYLMWTAFAATCITSSMFLTALAPNLLAVELVRKIAGVEISWADWFLGFIPVGALLLLSLPLVTYVLYPPEVKEGREVQAWAREELARMGAMTVREWIMGALVLAALGLWIFGKSLVDPTTVALIVICAMVLTGVVTWGDIVANKQAWNVLVWFATLVTLADGLNRVGFIDWFAKGAAARLTGLGPTSVIVVLTALFFLVHYLFASSTAHTTAVLPVVLAAGAAVPGIPVKAFALALCFSLGLMGVISPYATGPGPVWYGSGYVERGQFWKLGLVFGLLFLAMLLAVDVPYLLAVRP
ncbi:MAG TPA: anion permease [Anaeromyxobacteraceae bacterium]|nr:anion permease [Anaeromyxobacteraceae bacterium]